MDRKVFDGLAGHHGLTADGVEQMLDLAEARPSRSDVERFLVRVLHLAGVLSIAAGVVFFVASNWSALAVFGRFALVEALLVAAVGLALWRPPPEAVGRYALLFAFVVTGALFALYGQTYQTGADVYELFLNWALLGVVFAFAAQWSVVWAAWVLVLNVALWLFCGARPETGVLWVVFATWGLTTSQLLVVPLLVNSGLWGITVALQGTRWATLAPRWLGRFALACAVASGTWSGMMVVIGGTDRGGPLGLVAPLAVFVAVGLYTLRRREDVFPLAAIEGSLIILSTSWVAKVTDFGEVGSVFLIAAWLILTSTVCGQYLMRLVRAWDVAESTP